MPDASPDRDPSPVDDPAFLGRVMRYLDDALPAEGVAELERDLASDGRKREVFALVCYSDTLAREEIAAFPVPVPGTAPPSPRDARARPGQAWGAHAHVAGWVPRRGVRVGLAALLLIAATAALVSVGRRAYRPTAATLVEAIAVRWEGDERGPSLDAPLASGRRLALASGRIRLRFVGGTLAVVGGP